MRIEVEMNSEFSVVLFCNTCDSYFTVNAVYKKYSFDDIYIISDFDSPDTCRTFHCPYCGKRLDQTNIVKDEK